MKKRRFGDIRDSILIELNKGDSTANQISKNTQINWKTVDHHLVWLAANGFAEEVFASSYIHVYRISKKGKEAVERLAAK